MRLAAAWQALLTGRLTEIVAGALIKARVAAHSLVGGAVVAC